MSSLWGESQLFFPPMSAGEGGTRTLRRTVFHPLLSMSCAAVQTWAARQSWHLKWKNFLKKTKGPCGSSFCPRGSACHVLAISPHALAAPQPAGHGVPQRLWPAQIRGEIGHASTGRAVHCLPQTGSGPGPLQLAVRRSPATGFQPELQPLQLAAALPYAQRRPPAAIGLLIAVLVFVLLHFLSAVRLQQLRLQPGLRLPRQRGEQPGTRWAPGSDPGLPGGLDLASSPAAAVWRRGHWARHPAGRTRGRTRARGAREGPCQRLPGLRRRRGGAAQLGSRRRQLAGNSCLLSLDVSRSSPHPRLNPPLLLSPAPSSRSSRRAPTATWETPAATAAATSPAPRRRTCATAHSSSCRRPSPPSPMPTLPPPPTSSLSARRPVCTTTSTTTTNTTHCIQCTAAITISTIRRWIRCVGVLGGLDCWIY